MKESIKELNFLYQRFEDADDHARLGDMCQNMYEIKLACEAILREVNNFYADLNDKVYGK